MKLILLGAPGAGKGTQAELIAKKLDIQTISTGNILREAIKNQTEMGIKAKGYIDNGNLVPDNLIIEIIKKRLSEADCQKGYILDGVPRTLAQAIAMDEMGIKIDKVINIDVTDDVIKERMTGRRVCLTCGMTYHIKNNPSKKGELCDKCGQGLSIRKDDSADVVTKRLGVYRKQTQPLISFYEQKGILISVDGQKQMSEIASDILNAIGV